jgi:hypothetical protein
MSVLIDRRTTDKNVEFAMLLVAISPGDSMDEVYAEVDGQVNSPERRNPLKPRKHAAYNIRLV